MNPKVDFFFTKAKKWQEELLLLRGIALETGLPEELKWGCPCYVYGKSNIVLIHAFKEYCALLFFKGALLKDDKKILIQQTENVQAARQIRFTNTKEIKTLRATIKAYIFEAVEIEKAGLNITYKKPAAFKMADEFKAALTKNSTLKKAFEALTPGRQRAYLLHFSQPKLSQTRINRIEKATPQILAGKGLQD